MTRDEIIRMAREADFSEILSADDEYPAIWTISTTELERFAALVAAETEKQFFIADRIIEQALEHPCCDRLKDFWSIGPIQKANVSTFADLVAAAEREACAKECEQIVIRARKTAEGSSGEGKLQADFLLEVLDINAKHVAQTIRSRKEQ